MNYNPYDQIRMMCGPLGFAHTEENIPTKVIDPVLTALQHKDEEAFTAFEFAMGFNGGIDGVKAMVRKLDTSPGRFQKKLRFAIRFVRRRLWWRLLKRNLLAWWRSAS